MSMTFKSKPQPFYGLIDMLRKFPGKTEPTPSAAVEFNNGKKEVTLSHLYRCSLRWLKISSQATWKEPTSIRKGTPEFTVDNILDKPTNSDSQRNNEKNIPGGKRQLCAYMETDRDMDILNEHSNFLNYEGRNASPGVTLGKKESMSNEVLRKLCDKNYHHSCTYAEKMQKRKRAKDKLNAVTARLIYEAEESPSKDKKPRRMH
ncbi:hypothetical protein Tco_0545218 [Tanacetum coccineum]